MSDEILMNVTPREVRVAIVENGVLQELAIERTGRRGLVGSVFKGKVSRVLPGMQAAFVDVGLERTAFLHVSDAVRLKARDMAGDGTPSTEPMPDVTAVLHEGQQLLVQVVKDPLGTKGARLTTHISLPSRYLVFVPGDDSVGVSNKIGDEAERARLKGTATALAAQYPGGYIVRTAAEGATEDALLADAVFFQKLWQEIQQSSAEAEPCTLVYEDLPLTLRTLRDRLRDNIDKVRIDSRESHRKVLDFASKFMPNFVGRIEYYPGERPLFDLYAIEDEIQRALGKRVELKSGGHLVIDQTEAMTTIDVNTGAFVGHRTQEETIFKTNLEAAQAIARQLRLRNLGGIIILDFIDMEDEEHKRLVLRALEKSLARDRAKTTISGVSALGLVEMTRQRTQESLEHVLCESCPTCGGRGSLKTPETVCYEIFREIIRASRQFEAEQLLVLVSQEVADRMLEDESTTLVELEAFVGRPIKFQIEALYNQEQYDVVLM